MTQQTQRSQQTPHALRTSMPQAGETHAGFAQQPRVFNPNVAYDAAPNPEHHNLPPAPPPNNLPGGSSLGGGLGTSMQPVAAGYNAAFNNKTTSTDGLGAAAPPVADGLVGYPSGTGVADAASVQLAHSALAAGYMAGGTGTSALGGYGATAPAGGSASSGSARLSSTAVPAGAMPNGVMARAPAGMGMASGAITEGSAGYVGSFPAAAATAGGLVPQQQQLHHAAGGHQQQQQQQQLQQVDAGATLVAEHLEAAHRAYKAGRHLEALQLCNTVRDCLRIGSAAPWSTTPNQR